MMPMGTPDGYADAILAALTASGYRIVPTEKLNEWADAVVELRGRFRSETEEDWRASSRAYDAIMAIRTVGGGE